MGQAITLFGRCNEVHPENAAGELVVPWKSAYNFTENASKLISAEFDRAVVMPINSTPGAGDETAVRVSVDHSHTNFREFQLRFWLGDVPYHEEHGGPIDVDWVAFIPCAGTLT
ncbi:MAG: hypothetical protein U0R49_05610 [Fimbriimonadales bacterium]